VVEEAQLKGDFHAQGVPVFMRNGSRAGGLLGRLKRHPIFHGVAYLLFLTFFTSLFPPIPSAHAAFEDPELLKTSACVGPANLGQIPVPPDNGNLTQKSSVNNLSYKLRKAIQNSRFPITEKQVTLLLAYAQRTTEKLLEYRCTLSFYGAMFLGPKVAPYLSKGEKTTQMLAQVEKAKPKERFPMFHALYVEPQRIPAEQSEDFWGYYAGPVQQDWLFYMMSQAIDTWSTDQRMVRLGVKRDDESIKALNAEKAAKIMSAKTPLFSAPVDLKDPKLEELLRGSNLIDERRFGAILDAVKHFDDPDEIQAFPDTFYKVLTALGLYLYIKHGGEKFLTEHPRLQTAWSRLVAGKNSKSSFDVAGDLLFEEFTGWNTQAIGADLLGLNHELGSAAPFDGLKGELLVADFFHRQAFTHCMDYLDTAVIWTVRTTTADFFDRLEHWYGGKELVDFDLSDADVADPDDIEQLIEKNIDLAEILGQSPWVMAEVEAIYQDENHHSIFPVEQQMAINESWKQYQVTKQKTNFNDSARAVRCLLFSDLPSLVHRSF
jgi:hypothetical protein